MNVAPEIRFRNVARNAGTDRLIAGQLEKLERVCPYLSSCRIAVEKDSHRQPYHVRIELTVPPGHRLVVGRDPGQVDRYDLAASIRNAFESAWRELQALIDKQAGRTKAHPEQAASAWVDRIFPEDGYGFLRAADGREIYFHRNSLANGDFERLEAGIGVAFAEAEGEDGPQASTVRIVDRPARI